MNMWTIISVAIGGGLIFYWFVKHFLYLNFKIHVLLVLLENHIKHTFTEDEVNKAIDEVVDNDCYYKDLLRAIKTGAGWQHYENFRDLHLSFNYPLIKKRFKDRNKEAEKKHGEG